MSQCAENTHQYNAAVAMELPLFADWRITWKRVPDESGFTFPESEVENEQLFKLAESHFRSEEHSGSRS